MEGQGSCSPPLLPSQCLLSPAPVLPLLQNMSDDLIHQPRRKLAPSLARGFGFFSAELVNYTESMWWEHVPR